MAEVLLVPAADDDHVAKVLLAPAADDVHLGSAANLVAKAILAAHGL